MKQRAERWTSPGTNKTFAPGRFEGMIKCFRENIGAALAAVESA